MGEKRREKRKKGREGNNLVHCAATACLALDKIIHVYREQLHVHRLAGPRLFYHD